HLNRYLSIMFKWPYSILLVLIIEIAACGSPKQTTTVSTSRDSQKYTTAFPTRDVAEILEHAQRSTVRIISTAYYDTYTFLRPNTNIEDIRSSSLNEIASHRATSEESTAGTSII